MKKNSLIEKKIGWMENYKRKKIKRKLKIVKKKENNEKKEDE